MKTLSLFLCLTSFPFLAMAADTAAPAKAPGTGMGPYWQKIDANNDGFISHEEFMAGAENNFKEMDANHDGKVNRDEIQAHRKMMREKFDQMRAQRRAAQPQKQDAK